MAKITRFFTSRFIAKMPHLPLLFFSIIADFIRHFILFDDIFDEMFPYQPLALLPGAPGLVAENSISS